MSTCRAPAPRPVRPRVACARSRHMESKILGMSLGDAAAVAALVAAVLALAVALLTLWVQGGQRSDDRRARASARRMLLGRVIRASEVIAETCDVYFENLAGDPNQAMSEHVAAQRADVARAAADARLALIELALADKKELVRVRRLDSDGYSLRCDALDLRSGELLPYSDDRKTAWARLNSSVNKLSRYGSALARSDDPAQERDALAEAHNGLVSALQVMCSEEDERDATVPAQLASAIKTRTAIGVLLAASVCLLVYSVRN